MSKEVTSVSCRSYRVAGMHDGRRAHCVHNIDHLYGMEHDHCLYPIKIYRCVMVTDKLSDLTEMQMNLNLKQNPAKS